MSVSTESMSSTVSSSQGFDPPSRFGSYNFNKSGTINPSESQISDADDMELLSVSWNQDYTCFAAGTSRGFRIYNCEPFRETFRRELKNGGFGIVEMLFRCNILALVGGGVDSQYSPNKVMIWDDHQSRCIGEFSFRSEVRAVRLRRDRIVVVLEHKIYVYNFLDLKLLHQIETVSNPRGLCCLSHHVNTSVLACPGRRRGEVRIEHFGLHVTKIINAHESHLACFTLTMDGLLLATASTKGTLIRVFNTMDGSCLQEVRRGTEKAEIYGIAFSPNVQWLAVSSDRGTIHIFSLRVRVAGEDEFARPSSTPGLLYQNSSSSLEPFITQNAGSNPSLSLPLVKGVLPKYFSSEWSFARFHLPENTRCIVAFGSHNTVVVVGLDGRNFDTRCIVAFGSHNTVVVVGLDGRCRFNPNNGGEMSQLEYVRFLKTDGKPS